MESLFLEVAPLFTKEAGQETRLPENPESWQRDIAAEMLKQAPFISDYAVNIILEKVNQERGFALGLAEIFQKRDDGKQGQKVLVPVIVKDRMLKPMDVFLSQGHVYPLTEDRLRRAMFKTDLVHKSDEKAPYDFGLTSTLFPPIRTSFGFGNQVTAASDHLQKMGSLLEAIRPTISAGEVAAFATKVSENAALVKAASENKAFYAGLMNILTMPKVASASRVKPDVVQLRRELDGTFWVKVANTRDFNPLEQRISIKEAVESFGQETVENMAPGEHMTVSTNTSKKTTEESGEVQTVTKFGRYKCWDNSTNKPVTGWVFPITSMEGEPSGLFVFVSDGEDKVYALQDSIAGEAIAHSGKLPSEASVPKSGDWLPLMQHGNELLAFPPLNISHTSSGPNGMEIHGESVFGEPVRMLPSPQIKEVQHVGESDYYIPESVSWISLDGDFVQLVEKQDHVANMAEAKNTKSDVNVKGTGDGEYGLTGVPVSTLPTNQTTNVKMASAEFLLVGMGLTSRQARQVLSAADGAGLVKVGGMHRIRPSEPVQTRPSKPIDSLRADLVKVAAVIDDYDTVDKVLSLGFVNEDNLSTFKSFLPKLNDGVKKLAELLVASRIGVNQIPEPPVERAMKAMENVVSALRGMEGVEAE